MNPRLALVVHARVDAARSHCARRTARDADARDGAPHDAVGVDAVVINMGVSIDAQREMARYTMAFSASRAVVGTALARDARAKMRTSRPRARIATTSALGDTLPVYLARESARGHIDGELAVALNSVAVACKRVRALVASAPLAGNTGTLGSSNASGDEQKKLDVLANDVFVAEISSCGRAGIIVTEEEDTPIAVESVGGEYIVTFDPIDGSSNIDACVTTGRCVKSRVRRERQADKVVSRSSSLQRLTDAVSIVVSLTSAVFLACILLVNVALMTPTPWRVLLKSAS